ncbi:MAG: hypothetical protein P9L99_09365 [Candidatus Lernaella stagnicola]|nr:hypothetical protein [Candidatus Lernaella stagnicola]
MNQVFVGGLANFLLGPFHIVGAVSVGDFPQQSLGLFPIAFKGDGHLNFVPDEGETLSVIGDRMLKKQAVRHVNDASRALIGVHPVADFNDRELEEPNIHDIAGGLAELNAVANVKGATHENEQPTGHVRQRVLERHGDTGRKQPEIGHEARHPAQPDAHNEQDRHDSQNG